MRLVSVVLGAKSVSARESQTRQLLDYGFRFFETSKIEQKNLSVDIFKGDNNSVEIGIKGNYYLTLERGKFAKLTKKITIDNNIIAPIKQGQKLGELRFIFENKVLKSVPLVALNSVESAGFFGSLIDSIKLLF